MAKKTIYYRPQTTDYGPLPTAFEPFAQHLFDLILMTSSTLFLVPFAPFRGHPVLRSFEFFRGKKSGAWRLALGDSVPRLAALDFKSLTLETAPETTAGEPRAAQPPPKNR